MFCLAKRIDKQFTDVLQIRNFPCARSRLLFPTVHLQLSVKASIYKLSAPDNLLSWHVC